MKNISRRVFIKGLAVAGVAAAASTVLAGCNTNMIPGVDDGKDDTETPEAPVTTITLTDPDKNTLTVVSQSFVLGDALLADKTATVTFQVKNGLNQAVGFVDAKITGTASSAASPAVGSEGQYYVLVEAYRDGNDQASVAVATVKGDLIATGASDCIGQGATDTLSINFDVADVKKSLTVKMSLMKIVDLAASAAASKLVGEAQTITYTL